MNLALGEIFEEDARANLLTQSLDEGHGLGLVIAVTQVLLLDEVIIVEQLHVGALAEGIGKCGLTRGLGSDNA